MNSENSILGNQLVVMSRADLDDLVEKTQVQHRTAISGR